MGVGHYENFPVASWLCPPRLRAPVRAIYAFARTADDIADEGDAGPDQRLAELARYRGALTASMATSADSGPLAPHWQGIFAPLAAALRDHRLSPTLLHALLDAFEQDVRNPPYRDRDAVLAYCNRSANPIGRLLLQLYGLDDPLSLHQADAVCSALQLINFWQDLSIDLPRGRNYVPQTDASRHGVVIADNAPLPDSPAARTLVRDLVQWAGSLMAEGAPLPLRVPGRAGLELRLVVHGGWRILEKIARMDYASMSNRPRLQKRDVALLVWRSVRYSSDWFSLARLP